MRYHITGSSTLLRVCYIHITCMIYILYDEVGLSWNTKDIRAQYIRILWNTFSLLQRNAIYVKAVSSKIVPLSLQKKQWYTVASIDKERSSTTICYWISSHRDVRCIIQGVCCMNSVKCQVISCCICVTQS